MDNLNFVKNEKMSSSDVYQLNLNGGNLRCGNETNAVVSHDWVTYLLVEGDYSYAFADECDNFPYRIMLDDVAFIPLTNVCKMKYVNNGLKLFKIAFGRSNTNNTFNISAHYTPNIALGEGGKMVTIEEAENKISSHRYKKECVIDVHFNMPYEGIDAVALNSAMLLMKGIVERVNVTVPTF